MTKNRKFLALAVQIVAVIAILVTFSLCFVGCNGDVDPDAPPVDFNHDDLGRVPEEASIQGVTAVDSAQVTATSAELSTDEAVKATASYLFNLANANLEKVDYYANYAVGGGTANVVNLKMAGDMKVREVRIKDGAAMYMVTLGRVANGYKTGESSESVSWIIGICRGILDYGNRKYTPDGKTMYVQEGGSGCLTEMSVANFYTDQPYINWDKCGKVKSESIEDFMKNEYYRNHYFETNSSLINAKNLVNASVVRDDELGCPPVSRQAATTSSSPIRRSNAKFGIAVSSAPTRLPTAGKERWRVFSKATLPTSGQSTSPTTRLTLPGFKSRPI